MSDMPTMKTWTAPSPEGEETTYEIYDEVARQGVARLEEEIKGKEASGTAETKVSNHNTDTEAHNDIRLLLTELITQVNSFLDVDDTTRDQLSELLRDIDTNKTSIESITSGKVNVTDIINNLTTNVANKPLSAAQGVVLKNLIDTLQTAVTSHTSNGNIHITAEERAAWNAKQPAGSYALQSEVDSLSEEIADEVTAREQAIADLKAQGVQQAPLYAQGDTVDDAIVWLNTNGDTSKVYVLPNGNIGGYKKTVIAGGAQYTNLAEPLPDNTTDTTKWVNGYRLSSVAISAQSGTTLSNIIPCDIGDVIRVEGVTLRENADRIALLHTNDEYSDFQYWNVDANGWTCEYTDNTYIITITPYHNTVKGVRFAMPTPTDPSGIIITKNEEIVETESSEGYAWVDTGHAFVPNDYDEEFVEMNNTMNRMGVNIANLQTANQELEESVNELETKIENIGTTEIPDYWQTAIDSAKAKIADIHGYGGVGCSSFVWTSDIHAKANNEEKGKKLGLVAKVIMDEADIPLFVSTGDLMSQSSYDNPSNTVAELELARSYLEPIPCYQQALIMGNHDGAWGDSSCYYYKQLPLETMYNFIYRKQAMDFRRVSGDNGTYYYLDNVSQKMRYIMLNSNNTPDYEENSDGTAVYDRFHAPCYGQIQLDWLANIALDMPEDYTACIFAHEPLSGDYTQLVGIIDAYNRKGSYSNTFTDSNNTWRNSTVNVNFTNAKGEVAGVFTGHVHYDYMRYTGHNPLFATCPLITITTSLGGDPRQSPDGETLPTRTDGTATEFAMDIPTIDTKNRMIYLTRLGAGSDRVISY